MNGFRIGFVLLIGLISRIAFAQDCDIIILQDGSEIQCIVQEVGVNEVAYKKCDFIEGPLYKLLKNDVFIIKYKNGDKDVFQASETPKEVTTLTKKKIDPNVKVYEYIDEIPIDSKCLTVNFKHTSRNIEIIKIKGSSIIFYDCEARGMEKNYIMKSGIISIDDENGKVIYTKNYK
jgi:hypothetical protein